jgi:hypothetical protein
MQWREITIEPVKSCEILTFRFIVALENEENGKTKKWLLSAFDIIKRPK